MNVDTKSRASETLGNDSNNVDTKHTDVETFGNYGLGFVRVRKRTLKGGHPSSRAWRRDADIATSAASFEVVRAVRVNGKPRHKFVLGLGSWKNATRANDLVAFWIRAVGNMKLHGFLIGFGVKRNVPSMTDIAEDDPITLRAACNLFPEAKLTVSALRAEQERERLEIFRLGRRDYTTLRSMREMVRLCRQADKRRKPISIKHDASGALAAANQTVRMLKSA